MKNIKFLLAFFTLLAVSTSCSLEDGIDQDTSFLDSIEPTENIGAVFAITNDNSGIVTITPTGEGVTRYVVDFGDGSPVSDELKVGESVQHTYAEGEYEVVIIAKNLAGETTQGTQPLTVSFRTPENLEVNVQRDPQDNYKVNVSASADYAAMFEVYFGESADEEPTPLMPGETVSHTYATIGTYEIRVVARSGGEASLETTKEVTITDPLFLPINFESNKLDYTWSGFGGASGQVVDNPQKSGINTSSKVVELKEDAGAQTWAGISLQLDEPLDFSQGTAVKMKVWSPEAGVPVLFKIEDSGSEPDANGNPSVFVEVIVNTTTSGQWEEMTFNLASAASFNPAVDYDRVIVFYDFGNPGEGKTFYFDDIRLVKLEMIKFPLTFENRNLTYSWVGFGGAEGAVVANPNKSGINTSDFVTKLTKSEGAQTWAGLSLRLDEPVDFSAGTTVKMKVWSPKAGASILFKLEDSSSPPDGNGNPSVVAEVFVSTTTTGAWEELSFDLTTFAAFDPSIDYDNLVIFYDFGVAGSGTTFYFDDIRIGDTSYISLFSNFGENVNVDTWRTDWSAANYEEVTFEGRVTKHYSNLNFVGIETVADQLDITDMTHLHLDVYTDNATIFRVKLVDFGPDGAFAGGDDTEHEVVFENLPLNEWVSLDIPLSQFSNLKTREHISQLIFSAAPAGSANVYVTNLYFHN